MAFGLEASTDIKTVELEAGLIVGFEASRQGRSAPRLAEPMPS